MEMPVLKQAIIFVLACAAASAQISGKATISGNVAVSVLESSPITSAVCTASSTICTAVTIVGDPASNTQFSGYADPSSIKDPQTGTGWMSYSWLNTNSGAAAIETHICKFTATNTCTFVGVLYPSVTQTATGVTCFTSNEVAKILPVWDGVAGHPTNWIVDRLNYCTFAAGGSNPIDYTGRFSFSVAPDPDGLHGPLCNNSTVSPCAGTLPTVTWVGTTMNSNPDGNYPINQNFQTIDAAMNGCTTIREGTGIIDPVDGKLVWGFNCGNLAFMAQFVTNTAPTAGGYVWTYIAGSNAFGIHADATNVASYVGCTGSCLMTEFDWGANAAGNGYGTVVSIITTPGGNRDSNGCVWAEMNLTSRPYTFKRDTFGNILVDASATSPDSSASSGPGSCAYGPSNPLFIAHKVVTGAPQNGAFYSFVMQTALKPFIARKHYAHLAWTGSTSAASASYSVFRMDFLSGSPPAGPYPLLAGGLTSCTAIVSPGTCALDDYAVKTGHGYWYYIETQDSSGNLSSPSNIVFAGFP